MRLNEIKVISEELDPYLPKEGRPTYNTLATYLPAYYKDTHDHYMKKWGHAPVEVIDLGNLLEYIWPDAGSFYHSKMCGAKPLRGK